MTLLTYDLYFSFLPPRVTMFTLQFDNMWYILDIFPCIIIIFTSNNIFISKYFHILVENQKLGWPRKLGSKFKKK